MPPFPRREPITPGGIGHIRGRGRHRLPYLESLPPAPPSLPPSHPPQTDQGVPAPGRRGLPYPAPAPNLGPRPAPSRSEAAIMP